MKKIKLGYEVGTGEVVDIQPSHLIVTGLTQLSGKTTTLEALIHRSSFKAIVFRTKIGEKSFTHGTEVPPFFRERSDYEFVRSLIEAYSREKLSIEKGTLMTLCKGSKNLIDIKRRVDDAIAEGKLRGIKEEIYTRLQHYLGELIPQIEYARFSNTLNLVDGINIMNLERFSEEAQSLIIQSVTDEVLKTQKETVIVIPEAWKFIPQKYNNPCKRTIESFIRQGATNKNFIWIDSQDMAGVDKTPIKSVSIWILGSQAERNEVKHTLDQINLPKKNKPKEDEVMSLQLGQFFISTQGGVKKVYVQPVWMDDKDAKAISLGELDVSSVKQNASLVSNSVMPQSPFVSQANDPNLNKKLIELRNDFFNKIEEIATDINQLKQVIYKIQTSIPQIDVDEIISLVQQKMPVGQLSTSLLEAEPVDVDAIAKKIIPLLTKTSGSVTYEVAPLEKIKKDFLEEIKNKIIADASTLSPDEKKALKYLETQDRDIAPSELVTKCFMLKQGGSASTKISNILKSIVNIECVEKTKGQRYRKALMKRITSLMETHSADKDEMENVYNHILNELI